MKVDRGNMQVAKEPVINIMNGAVDMLVIQVRVYRQIPYSLHDILVT